jgi:hypothetical protein
MQAAEARLLPDAEIRRWKALRESLDEFLRSLEG